MQIPMSSQRFISLYPCAPLSPHRAQGDLSTVEYSEKYRREFQRKKQKAVPSLGDSEVSLTGSHGGVCDTFIFLFQYSSIIVGCIRGYRHGR
jgi:hypothetical protein